MQSDLSDFLDVLTGLSFSSDVFADASGIHGGHVDGVQSVRVQLLQDDAGLLPSNLCLLTRNMPAVSHCRQVSGGFSLNKKLQKIK